MTRRRLLAVAAAALALAAAAVLAALSAGAFAVGRDLRSVDLQPPPARSVPARLARDALGVGRELALREALRLARESEQATAEADRLRLRAEAEARLSAFLAGSPNAGRARAANALGVLTLRDAMVGTAKGERYLDLAVAALTQAIRADPVGEDAKYNLELLLELVPKIKSRLPSPRRGIVGGKAGAAPIGRGY